MELKKGFYPALGTPLDKDGNLMVDSYKKQIELMIEAGCAGALCMGSMGAEASLSSKTYADTAKAAVEAVNGRVPLFIGAMDNSVFRVKERCELLKGLKFDGLVLTTPFYGTTMTENLLNFFKGCADVSPVPVYLYDLPSATNQKITYDMVVELSKHKNIKGIKTADTVLVRLIQKNLPDFSVLYSNLDIFDYALASGIPRVLDGMFTCVPKNSAAFQKCYEAGDVAGADKYLDNILALRNLILKQRVWPGYTVAMNLLGLDGTYGTGFDPVATDEHAVEVKQMMKEIGEI